MVLMQKRPVEGDKSLPLLICVMLLNMLERVWLDTICFDHNNACIYAFNFSDQLFL